MSILLKTQAKDYSCKLFPFEREDCLSMQEVKQNVGWGITAFDLPKAWEFTQGEGVTIAVIDTGCDLDHPDLANNLVPGYNCIDPKAPPEDDNGHGCLAGSSLVYTSRGLEKIEDLYNNITGIKYKSYHQDGFVADIKEIDECLNTYSINHSGNTVISQITHVHKVPVNNDIIKVTLEGNIEIEFTPWHPTYTFLPSNHNKNKIFLKRADELNINDRFGIPNNIQSISTEYKILLGKKWHICVDCGRKSKNRKKCSLCNGATLIRQEKYKVDEQLAYLMGMICTDGYLNNRIEIISETKEILEKCEIIFLNLGVNVRREKNRLFGKSNDLEFVLHHAGICKIQKSLNQSIPKIITESSLNVIYAFLAGVIDGDGCISKSNTKNRITTVSCVFAKEICALMNSIGISCGIQKLKNYSFSNGKSIEERTINENLPILNCVFSALPDGIVKELCHPLKKERSCKNTRCKRKIRRIKKIERIKYQGYFYDFTVKDYHNYIADGHFVSNTHVSGVLVAENNGIGMVGVCPKAKVMPIKALDKAGNGNMLNVANAVRWAADNGADFISMSLGAPMPVAEVRKAIQYAHNKGVITFVAAGNVGDTKEVFYPAAYPETISVGAVSQDLRRAKFSNTGKNLDFMAPGVDIYSTVPDDWYAKMSGTSMAQPFLCGVAALVKSFVVVQNARPDVILKTAIDYRKLLMEHTIPVTNSNYDDPKFYQGFGIIDPRKFYESIKV